MKRNFIYSQYVKHTVLERTEFIVEAESQKEADEIVKREMKDSFAEDNFDVLSVELQKNTLEYLPVEENGNNATVTVERKDGENTIEVYNNEND